MSDQQELFTAETTWFHVFKSMIDSGDLAAMSGSDLKVYMVVKAYTNFKTGRAFPSLDTIAEGAGLSVAQVKRCLASLVDYGYITKGKKGRNNVYTLREKVQCIDEEGRPAAVATWDYLPNSVREAQAELKNFLMTGQQNGQLVHIERLTLNLFQDHAQQVNIGVEGLEAALEAMPADLRKKMEKALAAAGAKGKG